MVITVAVGKQNDMYAKDHCFSFKVAYISPKYSHLT